MDRLLEEPPESAALDRTPPNLLTLPFEIRKRILKHLLSTNLEENIVTGYRHDMPDSWEDLEVRRQETMLNVADFFENHYVPTLGYNLTPKVLWTCKQILCEGTAILVDDNDYIALRYQEFPTTFGPAMKEYMMKSGILTFWENPGIFKLPASQNVFGRPVMTIDLKFSEDKSLALTTVIVPFATLNNLCQALCASAYYSDDAVEKNELIRRPKILLNFCVKRIPDWKKLGFKVVVYHLQTHLFDWFQDVIWSVSCEAPTTGLDLELKIRDWILERPTGASLTWSQWGKQVVDTWAASVSFVEFNALLAFDWTYEIFDSPDLDVDQLVLWTHFYLGMSLLERANSKLKLDHDLQDYYRQARSVEFYLPHWECFPTNTGHQARLSLANGIAAGSLPLFQHRQDQFENALKWCLTILRNTNKKFDSEKLNQFDLSLNNSIWEAIAQLFDMEEEIPEAIAQAILDKFGEMSPVTLNVEGAFDDSDGD
ncbi:hypothetical protein LTR84_010440 [Exophiala bonariae]|uniref:F-box domain-containing protein n=1 Tax=Exophiala bonariae TaxID=1690606 RepID=A0AAV9MT23_9EURO|nr:hypothetical protein LTR84_010440 [Exophiala bonariae]